MLTISALSPAVPSSLQPTATVRSTGLIASSATPLTTDSLTAAVPARGIVPAVSLPTKASWSSPDVQQAFGDWLPGRWQTWKADHEEADCKSAAARMMTDFRAHYQEQTGVPLADPFKGQAHWIDGTRDKPNGVTRIVPKTGPVRPEYVAKRGQATIDGTNHMLMGFNADAVARKATTPVTSRDGVTMVARRTVAGGSFPKGDLRINQDELRPGDVIFQAHRHPDDTKWDHTMTVMAVEKGADGRTSRLTMAIGSFDDLKDNDAATAPNGPVNNYSYEQQIDFTNGEVSDAHITWQSDAALRPLGAGESLKDRIHRGNVVLGMDQKQTEVHVWGAR